MNIVIIELNRVYNTYDKLDKALKKKYGEDAGLKYQVGITTQEEFEQYVGSLITFFDGKTQIWAKVF